ncbi:unnamed protein product, partial [Sphenostylis stenocarpa]
LKEKNMALAKELATLKLATDLDIDEEEVLKLATFGNGANSKDTIDTLKISLVMQNRSYKELMAKCNVLRRGEARYSKKLDKAKEKIAKLKARVQELETLAEAKENEYLMSLKLSKSTKSSKNHESNFNSDSDALIACKFSLKEHNKQISTPKSGINLVANDNNRELQCYTTNKVVHITHRTPDKRRDYITIDEDDLEGTNALQGCSQQNYKNRDRDNIAFSKPSLAKLGTMSTTKTKTLLQGKCTLAESPRVDIDIDISNIPAGPMDEDVTLQTTIKQPVVNIRKESPFTISNSAVGADGRGGRIKVLRTPTQILSESFKGVSCDLTNFSVVGISLSGFSLSSSDLLPLVCKIETLEHLDVSNNHLYSIPDGFITECGKIKGLKLLNFSTNNLGGVLPTFHGFEALESLDMSFNMLRGNIVFELDGLVSLKSLNLTFNKFTGSLPTNLGKSMVLENLLLSNNRFDGEIPDELLSYENLTWIDLKANNLSRSIPINIGKLSKLETLILSANNLIGEIPTSLTSITKLSRFVANYNNFTGTIPPGITKYLTSLDLSFNNLYGTIPGDLLSPPQLQVVDLSNNMLNGSLPSKFSSKLFRLRLGSNQLNGNIPSDAFVEGHNLTYLELDNNSFTGSIPAELGSCRNLALLNLAQNQLSGVLPQQLGNLENLQVLKLQLNKLNSTIPTQIGQLHTLSTLNLSRNSLGGSIPSEITSLNALNFLYLHSNNLSGSIPTTIDNLSVLFELQLGENHLRGVIPKMPLSLQVSLNLSSNLFSGSIPSSFGRLNSLEVLDLSNNHFSGQIPDDLTKMISLTQLLLSNNPLAGEIPKFAQTN